MPGPHQWTTVVSHALLLLITRSGPNCASPAAKDEHSVNLGSEAYLGTLYQSATHMHGVAI
jgi:hypothetical protein